MEESAHGSVYLYLNRFQKYILKLNCVCPGICLMAVYKIYNLYGPVLFLELPYDHTMAS